MPQPTEAERKNLLSYDLKLHPEGRDSHVPGSLDGIPAGFGCVVLSMRVAEQANVIPSLVGPLSQPTLNVAMQAFDGRYQLGDGPGVLGVDETMHALMGGVTILAKSLPRGDMRQQWCEDVVQSFMRFQMKGRAVPRPPTPGAA